MNRPEADDEVEVDSGGCGEKVPDSTQRIGGPGDSTSASEQGKRSEASANVPKVRIPSTGLKTTESMGEIAPSSSDVSSDNNSLSVIGICENVPKNSDEEIVNINEGLKSFCDTNNPPSPDTSSLRSGEGSDIVLKWDDEDEEESKSKDKNEESDSEAAPADSEQRKNDVPPKDDETLPTEKDLLKENDDTISETDKFNLPEKHISAKKKILSSKELVKEIDDKIAIIEAISLKPKDLKETDNQSSQSVQASTADSDEINELALSDFTETDTNISRKGTDTSMTETAEVTDISKSSNDLKYESGESSMLRDAEEKDVSVDSVIDKLDQIIDEPDGNLETTTSGEVKEKPAPNGANEEFNIDTKKDKNEPAEVEELLDESVTNAEEILNTQITANSTFLDSEIGEPSDTSMSLTDSVTIEPRKHNLKEPNMMLEIPTQELIDCADDSANIFTGSSMAIDNSEIEVSNPEKCEDVASLKGGTSEIVSIAAQIPSKKYTAIELEPVKDTAIQLDSVKDNALEVEPEKTTTTETESGKSTDTETESEKATVILSKMKKIADIHEFNIKDDLGNGDSPLEGHSSVEVDTAIEEPVSNIGMMSKDNLGNETKTLDSEMKLTKEMSETEVTPNLQSAPNEIEDTTVELPTGAQASTSASSFQVPGPSNDIQMALDTSDEVPEVTDSLGLLAESFRVMEDDEEQETSEHDDGDDDDDDDVDADDDNSNPTTVENSEDSNAQHSETDLPKELEPLPSVMDSDQDSALISEAAANKEEELSTPAETPEVENEEFTFVLTNITSGVVEEEGNLEPVIGEEKQQEPEDSAIKSIMETEESLNETSALEDINVIDTPVESVKETTNEPVVTESTVDVAMETGESKGETSDVPGLLLKRLLLRKEDADPSPSKTKELEMNSDPVLLSIVDLGDSSSEEDIQEVPLTEKPKSDVATEDFTDAAVNDVTTTDDVATIVATAGDDVTAAVDIVADVATVDDVTAGDVVAAVDDVTVADDADDVTVIECDDVTTVNIPNHIEVMAMGSSPSQIVSGQGATVVSGVPRPHGQRTRFRLNTSELTIKPSASSAELTPLVIPEAKASPEKGESMDPDQILNISSDEEESDPASAPANDTEQPKPRRYSRCVNPDCTSARSAPTASAPRAVVAYYGGQRRRPAVCGDCARMARDREQNLITGIRTSAPLLSLEARIERPDLVEISDSEDSGDEEPLDPDMEELIGAAGASYLQENLTNMMNETWAKYNLDGKLQEAQRELDEELERLDAASAELEGMVQECQRGLDFLRGSLYAGYEQRAESLPALAIVDTPDEQFVCTETVQPTPYTMELKVTSEPQECKRRRDPSPESPPNKKLATQALKLPETVKQEPNPADTKPNISKLDDDIDVSVVRLSAESAPPDLPPPGEPSRPPLAPGLPVLAMRNAFNSWMRGRVVEVTAKHAIPGSQFTLCRVKFDSKTHKNQYKQLPARCLAYYDPPDVRMTIGTRLVALFKDPMNPAKRDTFYSGIVAEVPNPVNNYRYLVFFDDGYAQYVRHANTRLVCECSPLVWEEVHPFSRDFVKQYLRSYPERPMVRLHTGQSIKTEWNGSWLFSKVTKVDASLVQVHFEKDNRTEWIYRGSTRLAPLFLELQAAGKHRARPLPRNRLQNKRNMPYVEYPRSVELKAASHSQLEEARRQRAVAKKSVSLSFPVKPPAPPTAPPTEVPSRVVFYTPKNSVRPHKMVSHQCGPRCKRQDVLALQDLRTYNPLAKPLLSGWERQLAKFKLEKIVMYRAPCGRRIRNIRELHRYLRLTQSDMGVDLFDFNPSTHCLAEFVLNKCVIAKKDLSNGEENVPVPCVNYYDQSLPEFCSYNTERTPTEGVPLNLDPEFLCGCDCQDDCADKSKCACWQLTLAGARTIGMAGRSVGYSYKRLKEPLPTGIYECNSRCKCKSTCLNRVAQHPLQLKLQVFKTPNRGWGIRALNDVPRGAFLCVYAGNLLTDATANLDGLNEGDEYLAELDYIEAVEQMKEGYENDISEADKMLDKEGGGPGESTEEEDLSSEDEEDPSKNDDDCDFEPGYNVPVTTPQFNKRLRRREMKDREDAKGPAAAEKKDSTENDCITISDDEEVREPSSFSAQLAMGDGKFISKYKSVRSLYGEDEACYIMDAKVQGNIGRYLNHSCAPNVFVQNVFVDTHDPRFPWVAFFALLPIKAGTELTWNYSYDIGSVPGKILYCYCGADNCRGRLL